jgi:two-component system response regulator FixJ
MRCVEAGETDAILKRFDGFTDREREVLDLIVAGNANKQIATTLNISIKTVAVHRAKIMLKTQAATSDDLVRMSMIASQASPQPRSA